MENTIFGIPSGTVYSLLSLLLLLVLGLLTFQYYVYVSGKNGLNFGTGFDVSLLPNLQKSRREQHEQFM